MNAKNRIPKELLSSVFTPEFKERSLNLNNFIKESYLPQEKIVVAEKIETLAVEGIAASKLDIPIPLTEQEAEEADKQIALALDYIAKTKNKLIGFRENLSKAVLDANGGKELQFTVDISKKRRLRKAIKTLYGDEISTISYSMYIEMVKAKAMLEMKEARDFTVGKTKEEEN